MNFARLSSDVVEIIFKKCQFQTIAKLMQTNSTINITIRKKKLDKMSVNQIWFARMSDEMLEVTISGSAILGDMGLFEKEYDINKPSHDIEVLLKVLNSVKSVNYIQLGRFEINEAFVQLLTGYSNILKNVSLEVTLCYYKIPKTELIQFWKLFKTVTHRHSCFRDGLEEILTDEIMLQTQAAVTFDSYYYKVDSILTDKSLEELAKAKHPIFSMKDVVAKYTIGGIRQLFTAIIERRDSSVQQWLIGSVRIDYATIMQEMMSLVTECTKVYSRQQDDGHRITVVFKKKGSDEIGILAVHVVDQ